MRYLFFFFSFVCAAYTLGMQGRNVVYDMPDTDMRNFFSRENTQYIIRHPHHWNIVITIPTGCELNFQGGLLSGGIVFNGTKLCGNVRLQGSNISGTIVNRDFYSKWLCYADGIHDDAENINQMINVGSNILFTKGTYRLVSLCEPSVGLDPKLWKYPYHIGINKSHVSMKGIEDGVVIYTSEVAGTICIYSLPGVATNTIKGVSIENITFRTANNGTDFHEYLHIIKTIGVDGLNITDCRFDDFWGDAICLSTYGDIPSTGERARNSNVKIQKNTITGGSHYNTGNGISVINGKNVVIDGNIIKHTSKKHMPGAIDVEANNSAYTVDGITISNNVIQNCHGTAGGIAINANQYGAPAHNIKILNNHISGCTSGLAFYVKSDNTTSNYTVVGNVVDSDTPPFKFYGKGKSTNWIFKNNKFHRPTLNNIPGDIKVSRLTKRGNKYAFTKD